MVDDMRTISLAVNQDDYEAFRRKAAEQGRSIAQLIREAMGLYRSERIERRSRLTTVAVLAGHRAKRRSLPSRHEVYDEAYG
jgi:hypothetical protein